EKIVSTIRIGLAPCGVAGGQQSAVTSRMTADCRLPTADCRLFLPWIVGGVDVRDGEGPDAVYLDRHGRFREEVMMHLRRQPNDPAGARGLQLRVVPRIAHAERGGAGQHRDVLVGRMPVRRDLVSGGSL